MLAHQSPTAARQTTALSAVPRGPRPGEALPKLLPEQVARAYRGAQRRVILLGLDGTLIQHEQVVEHLRMFHDFQGYSAQPSAETMSALAALASDPANVIYVISGRAASDMQATLGKVPGLGLAAELGYTHLPHNSSQLAAMEGDEGEPSSSSTSQQYPPPPPPESWSSPQGGGGVHSSGGSRGVQSGGGGSVERRITPLEFGPDGYGFGGSPHSAQQMWLSGAASQWSRGRRYANDTPDDSHKDSDSGYGDADTDEDQYGVSSPRHAAAAAAAAPPMKDMPFSQLGGGVGGGPHKWAMHGDTSSGLSSGPSSFPAEHFALAQPKGWSTLLLQLPPAVSHWRESACRVMRQHTLRTNGAYERSQASAVQWCYHDADPDYGLMQARALTATLREKLVNTGVVVTHSLQKRSVEVRLAGVNKGTAADLILSTADSEAPVDFLLCIGDDDDDEFMLSATTARASAPGLRERLHGRLFTVSVGNREKSHAQSVMQDSSDVIGLLEMLQSSNSPPGGGSTAPTSPRQTAAGTRYQPPPPLPQFMAGRRPSPM